jgi:hypothetical protein
MNVKLSKVELIVLLVDLLDNQPAFKNITDDNGYIIIPADKYGDFAHDVGLCLGRLMQKIAKPESEETF